MSYNQPAWQPLSNAQQGQPAYQPSAAPTYEPPAAPTYQPFAAPTYQPSASEQTYQPYVAPQAGAPTTYGAAPVQYQGQFPYPAQAWAPPRPSMSFGQACRAMFQNYATFNGRAGMGEYWWPQLLFAVLESVLLFGGTGLSLAIAPDSSEPPLLFWLTMGLFLIVVCATYIPLLALRVRRLHDAGFSGWFSLLGGTVGVILCCLPSKPEGARYDAPDGSQPATGGAR